jgi:hypothetical protein
LLPLIQAGYPHRYLACFLILVQGLLIMRRSVPLVLRLTLLVVAAVPLLAGCNNRAKIEAQIEKPISAAAIPTPAPASKPVPKLPPPTQAEVEAAFHRIFGDDLAAQRGPVPFFIVGDFNGDESEDVAILARPAPGKLDDINSELSNWIIQDADKAFIPAGNKAVVTPPVVKRPSIEKGEVVLAIIHGVGPGGWRNPDARQTYIVKHAAATFRGIAPSVSQKAIRAMKLPVETDIIKEVRNNKKGFLFWTGSLYAWHPEQG